MGVNPWAIVILAVALLLVIIGVKGSQDNLIAAIKGKPHGKSTLK